MYAELPSRKRSCRVSTVTTVLSDTSQSGAAPGVGFSRGGSRRTARTSRRTNVARRRHAGSSLGRGRGRNPRRGLHDARVVVRLTPEVVAGMQRLAREQRRLLGARAPWHVGDITWGLRQHEGRESRVEDTALGRGRTGRRLVMAAAGRPRQAGARRRSRLPAPARTRSSPSRIAAPHAHSRTTPTGREALERHGFTAAAATRCNSSYETSTSGAGAAAPCRMASDTRTSKQSTCRSASPSIVRSGRSPEGRRASRSPATPRFAPNGRTIESLDCVVEAPDGRFAAYCLCWPDDENRVGELEPVGVRAEFRRRGFGAAICTFALQRLHEEGCREAIVYCASPPACALYESLGFRVHASLVEYRRVP